jgi:hypothetical protein
VRHYEIDETRNLINKAPSSFSALLTRTASSRDNAASLLHHRILWPAVSRAAGRDVINSSWNVLSARPFVRCGGEP